MYNINQDIGKRISTLRKSHGITQASLAENLDITIKHISSVERGISSLSLDKMIEASKLLDCTLDYLVLGKDYENVIDKLPASVLNVLNSKDENEISLLLDYMNLYGRLRRND
ncbi:MAG: helix-turn-helix transcriptional regulator [Lachnospiraceae bacterium]|nr:helix-turn-helix transcriptional regulator [Lachnospiraceae bacterium]